MVDKSHRGFMVWHENHARFKGLLVAWRKLSTLKRGFYGILS